MKFCNAARAIMAAKEVEETRGVLIEKGQNAGPPAYAVRDGEDFKVIRTYRFDQWVAKDVNREQLWPKPVRQ